MIFKKLIFSTKCSLFGIYYALAEKSFVLEILLLTFEILTLFYLQRFDILILLSGFGVLILELINTSIELLCNMIEPAYSLNIKKIKDMASAAVFLALILNLFLFLKVVNEKVFL